MYLKRLLQNTRRTTTVLIGLVLAIALIAGISLHIDYQSRKTLDAYLNDPNRVIDIFIETGRFQPEQLFQEIKDRQQENNSYPFIKDIIAGHRWHVNSIDNNAVPEWQDNEAYSGSGEEVPILSINGSNLFHQLIILINGTLDTSASNVVITESFYEELSAEGGRCEGLQINDTFHIFDWWLNSNFPANQAFLKNMNFTRTLTLKGIISDSSPLLKVLREQGDNWQSIYYPGIIISSIDILPDNFFYQTLAIKPGNFPADFPSFTDFIAIRIKNEAVDLYFPENFLPTLNEFQEDIEYFFSTDPFYTSFNSVLREIIQNYVEWVIFSRAAFLVLSFPIIFLGWFLLDFSLTHTFKERYNEFASLKSRGMDHKQIFSMLFVEITVTSIIGSIIGLFFGVLVHAVMETSIDFLQFDFQLLEFNLNLISPITLIFCIISSFLLMFLGSFSAIRKVLSLPIDEMQQAEFTLESETDSELKLNDIRKPLIITLIAIFFIYGVSSMPSELSDMIFPITLGIIGLGLLLIGALELMSKLAGLLPYFLNSVLNIGSKSTQLFIIAREMVRQPKRVRASFIVLSLTIAFGIMSSIATESSTIYFSESSRFEVGADLRLNVKPFHEEIPMYLNDESLSDNGLFPEIANFTRIFEETTASYVEPGESIDPTMTADDLYRDLRTYQRDPTTAIFIDYNSYFSVAFLRDDFFVDSTVNDVKNAFQNNPNQSAIIDATTAREQQLSVGDTIRFLTGSKSLYNGTKTVVGIANYISPGYDAKEETFVLISIGSISDEYSNIYPGSCYLINKNQTFLNSNNHNYDITFANIQKFQMGFVFEDLDDADNFFGDETNQGRQFIALVKILRINFYYAAIITLIGFFLVLELKVYQNAREISVMKALGLGNIAVINLIVLEATITILVASFTGLVMGIIGGTIINGLIPEIILPKATIFPIMNISLQFIFALISALIGAIIAGSRTLRFKIVELIRHG